MKELLKQAPAPLLISLWIYTAVSKLLDFSKFRGQLYNQNIPMGVAEILVYALPALELAAVAMLLTQRFNRPGMMLSAALMTVFTGYTGLVIAGYWDRIPCSCGGILQQMSWEVHFVFNIVFLLISLAGLKYKGKAENLRKE